VLHHFPGAQVEYRFKCRSKGIDLQPYIDEIRSEIHALCQLKFSEDELDYLRNLRFIKGDFVEFLGLFHLPEKCISVTPGQEPGEISIEVKGSWLHTILFEIPVLAIVNEVYFRNKAPDLDYEEGRRRLEEKIQLITSSADMANFKVAEYGTRRDRKSTRLNSSHVKISYAVFCLKKKKKNNKKQNYKKTKKTTLKNIQTEQAKNQQSATRRPQANTGASMNESSTPRAAIDHCTTG